MSTLNIATRYVAPLAEVLVTLPLFRAASPWRRGALLYRTRDGKLYPYQPGSSEQGTWNELYFARPGSGKSATMNANNLGLVLSSGFRRLPFVRIIDIGPSSEGLIDLLREGLPPDRRHEAQFHALVNGANWAVNPLDTQLGWRQPLPQERAFLVSFLSVLATKPGDREPAEGIADLIGLVLDLAYAHFADEHSPKRYVPEQDAEVDQALVRHAIALDAEPTWWEVVDALFDAGRPRGGGAGAALRRAGAERSGGGGPAAAGPGSCTAARCGWSARPNRPSNCSTASCPPPPASFRSWPIPPDSISATPGWRRWMWRRCAAT
ncbi:MAG: hypothetical protein V9H25_13520 [Candidatus Competibacter sp.]